MLQSSSFFMVKVLKPFTFLLVFMKWHSFLLFCSIYFKVSYWKKIYCLPIFSTVRFSEKRERSNTKPWEEKTDEFKACLGVSILLFFLHIFSSWNYILKIQVNLFLGIFEVNFIPNKSVRIGLFSFYLN